MANESWQLPFNEQIDFLKQKVNLPTATYKDIDSRQHDKAFVVAGAMKADLLTDLHNAINQTAAEGKSFKWFQDNFDDIIAKHGWLNDEDKGYKAWRARMIYQTNMRTSHAAGRYKQMTDPEVLKRRPYWRYRHNSIENPRISHQRWNNLVLPANSQWWKINFPPNGYGCKCTVEAINERQLKAMGKSRPDDEPGYDDHRKDFLTAPGASWYPDLNKYPEPIARQLKQSLDEKGIRPAHVLLNPKEAIPDDFIQLGQQRLKDMLDITVADGMTMQHVMESVKLNDYGEYHLKLNKWIVQEMERTRQAGTVAVNVKGGHQARKLMTEATGGYPATWVQAANQYGTLHVKYSKQRGWAATISKDGLYSLNQFGVVKAKKNDGYIVAARHGTAVHEFAHRIQAVRPDIDDIFQQEHRKRTLHDVVKQLTNQPKGEIGKEDGYYNSYMGRHYDEANGREALELMTMAFEPILGNDEFSARKMFNLYHKDPRMLELALGILFHAE